MNLNQLPKITARSNKRLGRGIGSGKGKTAARGYKGQKARGKVAMGFIGGTLPIYKKLPFRRGLGNPKVSPKFRPLSLDKLADLKANTTVTLQTLVENKIISEKQAKKGIKIVGGSISIPLTISLPISKLSAEKVTKAGGKVS